MARRSNRNAAATTTPKATTSIATGGWTRRASARSPPRRRPPPPLAPACSCGRAATRSATRSATSATRSANGPSNMQPAKLGRDGDRSFIASRAAAAAEPAARRGSDDLRKPARPRHRPSLPAGASSGAPFLPFEKKCDRLAEFRLGDRAHVRAGHFAEHRIGQRRGELFSRAIVRRPRSRKPPASAW